MREKGEFMVGNRNSFLSGSVIRANEAQLTDEFATRLGYVFAMWTAEKLGTTADKLAIAVGHDSRPSGKRLLKAFVKGLTSADSDVYDCGLSTTPAIQMSMELKEKPASAAAMITASAASADMNGFKLFIPEGSLNAEQVQHLLDRAKNLNVPQRLVQPLDLIKAYRERLTKQVYDFMGTESDKPLSGLKVVVDASNGSAGFFADFLAELGVDTSGSFNLDPKGEFEAEIHNPENSEALDELSKAVLRQKADLDIMLDIDGDRVAIVDEHGKVINRNRLIALISAILLEDEKGLTIVTDSVTSSGLSRFITEWGGRHYRFRRGYRNVIDEAKRLNAEGFNVPVAIETSGHAAMAENYFIDDGVYLAAKVVCEAKWRKNDGLSLTSLIDELQEPVESLSVRLPIIQDDYKKAAGYVIEAVLSSTLTNPEWKLAPDNREGVRIMFSLGDGIDNAWFMLRLSVHDPVLAINAESEIKGGLLHITQQLYQVLEKDNEELDLTPLREKIEQLKK
ncbi:MAG: phosphomannomutase/phosphoglucomutase [Clostridia bacterium]|nr:phosphomannomutase/phosphoglucomutase [Clostridia bacterium]